MAMLNNQMVPHLWIEPICLMYCENMVKSIGHIEHVGVSDQKPLMSYNAHKNKCLKSEGNKANHFRTHYFPFAHFIMQQQKIDK